MMRMTWKAKEAAGFLGISYWKVLDMAKKGEIPHIRVGKLVLFRRESVEKWLTEHETANMAGGDL